MKKLMPIFLALALIFLMAGMLLRTPKSGESTPYLAEVRGEVVATDDSEMIKSGISMIGNQVVSVRVLEGTYQGEVIEAHNHLMGKLELDQYYKTGDQLIVAIIERDGKFFSAKTLELYRQGWELVLFAIFVLALVLYAGYTGLKALFSFVASLMVIWKFLIPGLLSGKDPLTLATLTLIFLAAIILFSIAGFTRKGLAAFIGTLFGMLVTIGITIFFGEKLGLMGMTAPFAETLLYNGNLGLNMKGIFYAAIIIGASGAAMDIAIDIAASMEEVKEKKPDISAKELIQSGFNVGRSVIGTMTTTLLLAYSGGYLTLLMLFTTKNTSFVRILNFKMVAAEIMRTVSGSIGLVLVAPITAFVAGWIYTLDLSEINRNKSNRQ